MNLNKVFRNSYYLTGLIFILIAALYYWAKPASNGTDEGLFISDLASIHRYGWTEAIKKGISIPYLILAYPLTFFFQEHIALRLVNKIILVYFFYYLYTNKGMKKEYLYFYLLFYVSAAPFYYAGTNDNLFFISLSIFLIESYRASINTSFNSTLALSALVIAIFTRSLFVMYLPVIALGIWLLVRKGGELKPKIAFPLGFFFLFLILNLPSFQIGKGISYDEKTPPKGIISSWSQRQYLAQLQANQEERPFQSHPSWEETDAFLKINGDTSLPNTTLQGVLFDIPLTLKEFFKDLFYIALYHSRTTGLIVTILLIYFLYKFIEQRKLNQFMFAPVAIILTSCTFALIIISWVELRWLGAIFLMCIIIYSDLQEKKEIPAWALNLNYIFLTFLCIYGSYGLILKLLNAYRFPHI